MLLMVLCYFSNYFYATKSIIQKFKILKQIIPGQIVLKIYLNHLIMLQRNRNSIINCFLSYQIIIKFYVFI